MYLDRPSRSPGRFRKLISGLLALLLVGLGVLVRSESAHDSFHRDQEQHAHGHHHHHGHDHSHHSGHNPFDHEHTNPVLDLFAEEHLVATVALVVIPDSLCFEGLELPHRVFRLTPAKAVVQPPERAPPSSFS